MNLLRHRIRKAMAFGLPASMVALTALAAPGAVSAATSPITFNMEIFGSCVQGSAAYPSTVNVTWRDSSGTLKTQGVADHPYDSAYFELCDSALALMPGDKLKVTDGTNTRQYTVPNLTLHIDRVNDVYTGTGPAGRTVRLWIQTGDFGRGHSIRVAQDGTWMYDPHEDLQHYTIGYSASLEWKSPNNDVLNIYDLNAPYLVVTLNRAKFTGETDPITGVDVSLEDGTSAMGSATGDGHGYFAGTFTDVHGHAVRVRAGDHVSAPNLASDADWIVPQIDGTASIATDQVTGRCYDSGTSAQQVTITVFRQNGRVRGTATRSTDPDGSFSINMRTDVGDFFERSANIKRGDRVIIGCTQTTGDIAQLAVIPN